MGQHGHTHLDKWIETSSIGLVLQMMEWKYIFGLVKQVSYLNINAG